MLVILKYEIKVILSGMRQVAITCRRGTSVARSPKLLALPYSNKISFIN